MSLAALFPDEDFRFHLTLRRGDAAEFFRRSAEADRVLDERRRWLTEPGARFVDVRPEAEAAVRELAELSRAWIEADAVSNVGRDSNARSCLITISSHMEPDLLLLSPGSHGELRLAAGALCFPTAWALEEKIGQPMRFIHGPVPGLNAALSAPIDAFLARLKPGPAYLRDNWGLAATGELNLHPALGRPRLAPPLDPRQLWLRVERQALVALPQSSGVLFGIRIELHPFTAVVADSAAAAGLRRALATMPDEMARYKNLASTRSQLLALLS